MRARSRWMTVAAAGAVALGVKAAAADSTVDRTGVRIDQLQPASPESVFFRAEGPHTPNAEGVEFAVGLTFEYGKGLLKEYVLNQDGTKGPVTPLVENALLGRVQGSISPLHWLVFDLSLPVALFETGTKGMPYDSYTPAAGKGPGVGDLRVGVHFRPIDTKTFGLTLGGRFWAPFGMQPSYLSDGNFRAEVDIAAAGDVGRILYGCTLSIGPGFFAKRDGDRLGAACGVHVALNEMVSLGVEPAFQVLTHGYVQRDTFTHKDVTKNDLQYLFEPLGAVRLRFGGFRVGFGAGPGFGGGMGAAEIRGMASVAYVGLGKPPKPPPVGPSDRDLDKIPDDQDACPDEAGPPSRDPKTNGCPAHDRDGDGIRDDEDYCPDRPGIPYPDPNANGCPDTDNDGLPDPIDKCVNEPGAPPTGCPKYAHLATGSFKIDPPIEFGPGEKLRPEGRAALEEIAATMRANPKLEQVSVSIGTKGVRPALSDKRAQEILLVLRASNLDSNRYEVVLRDDVRAGTVQVRIVR